MELAIFRGFTTPLHLLSNRAVFILNPSGDCIEINSLTHLYFFLSHSFTCTQSQMLSGKYFHMLLIKPRMLFSVRTLCKDPHH